MKNGTVLKIGKALDKYIQSKRAAEAHLAEVNRLRGRGKDDGICYGYSDSSIQTEIPLAMYLALYPDAKPTLETWDSDGQRYSYMNYRHQAVGTIREGVTFWVHARTESVSQPIPVEAEKQAQQAA